MKIMIKLSLIISLLAVVTGANATSVATEQEKLDRLEQSFENRQVSIEDLENDLEEFQSKFDDAKKDLADAEEVLKAASADLAVAEKNVQADPGQLQQREVKKKTHGKQMAERGLRSRTKRLDRLQGKVDESVAGLEKARDEVGPLQKRIEQQKERIQVVIAHLERQAAASEKARKEAALKARMKPAVKVVKKAPAPKLQSKPVVAAKAAPVKVMSEFDKEALSYAQNEVGRLETLLAEGSKGRPTFKRLLLRGSKIESEAFEFLGKNQYRTEMVVNKGKQFFEVGRFKYRRTVPASDDGQTYVFIFDAKRLSRPRLVMYKKSLLEQI